MEYKKILQDFAIRTQDNLQLIYKQVEKEGSGFEVTQLVNSFLGLLVIFDEIDNRMLDGANIKTMVPKIWPIIGDISNISSSEFRKKIHLIRNAFAHSNLSFDSEQGDLSGVHIRNRNNFGETTWHHELSIEEMHFLFDRLCEIIMNL